MGTDTTADLLAPPETAFSVSNSEDHILGVAHAEAGGGTGAGSATAGAQRVAVCSVVCETTGTGVGVEAVGAAAGVGAASAGAAALFMPIGNTTATGRSLEVSSWDTSPFDISGCSCKDGGSSVAVPTGGASGDTWGVTGASGAVAFTGEVAATGEAATEADSRVVAGEAVDLTPPPPSVASPPSIGTAARLSWLESPLPVFGRALATG